MSDPTATLRSEFLAQVLGTTPPRPEPLHPYLPTADLVDLVTQAATHQGRSEAPRFSPADRERLAGKRPSLLVEILIQCAAGLHLEPVFAQKIGVPRDLLDTTVAQDAALGRLVKASGDAFDAAEEAAAQTAEAADRAAQAGLDGAVRRAAAHPEERADIAVAFADARRLQKDEQDRAGKQKQKTERKLRDGRAALQQLRQETAELRLLRDQLDAPKPDA